MTGVLAIASVTAGSSSPPGRGGEETIGDGSVLCAPHFKPFVSLPSEEGRQCLGNHPGYRCVTWPVWQEVTCEPDGPNPLWNTLLHTHHLKMPFKQSTLAAQL